MSKRTEGGSVAIAGEATVPTQRATPDASGTSTPKVGRGRATVQKWCILLVFLFWLVPPLVTRHVFGTWDLAGHVGDAFGLVTSLFSGLALLGVIYTIAHQNTEAAASEERRRAEQGFATGQIYQLALSTQLQSARALITENRRAISQLNPAIREVPVAVGRIKSLMSSIRAEAQSNATLRKHETELLERLQELVELQEEINQIRTRIRENQDHVRHAR